MLHDAQVWARGHSIINADVSTPSVTNFVQYETGEHCEILSICSLLASEGYLYGENLLGKAEAFTMCLFGMNQIGL